MTLVRIIGLARGLHLSRRQWLAGTATLAVMVMALVAPLPIPQPTPQTRPVLINARTFEFTPGVVRVNRGDTVVVKLESADVVHGLYLDGYGVSTQAEPGQPGELSFVADRSGAFHFRCAVPCGNLHPFMIGKLIVEPNLMWLRAVLASLAAAIGALAAFWRG
jgi:heme/copper-type cytochrome/quinol oxidase subunit 2